MTMITEDLDAVQEALMYVAKYDKAIDAYYALARVREKMEQPTDAARREVYNLLSPIDTSSEDGHLVPLTSEDVETIRAALLAPEEVLVIPCGELSPSPLPYNEYRKEKGIYILLI